MNVFNRQKKQLPGAAGTMREGMALIRTLNREQLVILQSIRAEYQQILAETGSDAAGASDEHGSSYDFTDFWDNE